MWAKPGSAQEPGNEGAVEKHREPQLKLDLHEMETAESESASSKSSLVKLNKAKHLQKVFALSRKTGGARESSGVKVRRKSLEVKLEEGPRRSELGGLQGSRLEGLQGSELEGLQSLGLRESLQGSELGGL